jgi:hypothetical protein
MITAKLEITAPGASSQNLTFTVTTGTLQQVRLDPLLANPLYAHMTLQLTAIAFPLGQQGIQAVGPVLLDIEEVNSPGNPFLVIEATLDTGVPTNVRFEVPGHSVIDVPVAPGTTARVTYMSVNTPFVEVV